MLIFRFPKTISAVALTVLGLSGANAEELLSVRYPSNSQDVLFAMLGAETGVDTETCKQLGPCQISRFSDGGNALAWGLARVDVPIRDAVEKDVAYRFRNDVISLICPETDVECRSSLGKIVADDYQTPIFDHAKSGTRTRPFRGSFKISNDLLVNLFHTVSFLQYADRILESNGQNKTHPSYLRVQENLSNIFKQEARASYDGKELIDRLEDARIVHHSDPVADELEGLLSDGYIHAVRLFHAMFRSFQMKVTQERRSNSVSGPVHAPLKADFAQHLRATLDQKVLSGDPACNAVIIYIHGFKNVPKDAIRDAALVAEDGAFCGVPVALIWPSEGTLFERNFDRCVDDRDLEAQNPKRIDLSRRRTPSLEHRRVCRSGVIRSIAQLCEQPYWVDKRSAEEASQVLSDFLKKIDEASSGGTKVHIIAHSMGSHVVTRWLSNSTHMAGRLDLQNATLSSLILIAGDASAREFEAASNFAGLTFDEVKVYGSADDFPLHTSRCLHESFDPATSERVGLFLNPNESVPEGVTFVDVSSHLYLGKLNHSYQNSNKLIAEEMRHLFAGHSGGAETEEGGGPGIIRALVERSDLNALPLPITMQEFWQRNLPLD